MWLQGLRTYYGTCPKFLFGQSQFIYPATALGWRKVIELLMYSNSGVDADQMASTYAGEGFLVDLTGRFEKGWFGGGPVVALGFGNQSV